MACWEYHRYFEDYTYRVGTQLLVDGGGAIINYPQQQYDNGVKKNLATGGRYKFITRAIKRLRNDMVDSGILAANPIPSYLVECLVYLVPNEGFNHKDDFTADVRWALAHLYNNSLPSDEAWKTWTEVNEFKYLLHSSQPWTRDQVHDFISAAWDYVGFH